MKSAFSSLLSNERTFMENQRVRKAIIPAAGLGTRFLPFTKSMPKEMLPIVDTPNIQLIVEEAVKSGIEEILIITNQNKHAMENHFDINYELEMRLKEAGKAEQADYIHQLGNLINIHYIRQKEPKGLGHAILCAETFVGNEPFAILLGDDLIVSESKPALMQLLDVFNLKKNPVLGVQKVPHEEVRKYGIVKPSLDVKEGKEKFKVVDMVEKPSPEEAPSDYAVLGRYILTPDIFQILKNTEPGKNNEIQLTDALKTLMSERPIYACNFIGERYDIGSKFGFIKANIDFALKRADLHESVANYIKSIAKKL